MSRTCIIEGCDRQARGRDLCYAHYARWKRGTLEDESPIGEPVRVRDYVYNELRTRLLPSDWLDLAPCKGMDTSRIFYPGPGAVNKGRRGLNASTYSEARKVCAACPYVEPCLEEALSWENQNGVYGFRGGKTPQERRVMLRDRRRGVA